MIVKVLPCQPEQFATAMSVYGIKANNDTYYMLTYGAGEENSLILAHQLGTWFLQEHNVQDEDKNLDALIERYLDHMRPAVIRITITETRKLSFNAIRPSGKSITKVSEELDSRGINWERFERYAEAVSETSVVGVHSDALGDINEQREQWDHYHEPQEGGGNE